MDLSRVLYGITVFEKGDVKEGIRLVDKALKGAQKPDIVNTNVSKIQGNIKILSATLPKNLAAYYSTMDDQARNRFLERNYNTILDVEKAKRWHVFDQLAKFFLHEHNTNSNPELRGKNRDELHKYAKKFAVDRDTGETIPTLSDQIIDELLVGSKYDENPVLVEGSSIFFRKAATFTQLKGLLEDQDHRGKIARTIDNIAAIDFYGYKFREDIQRESVKLYDLFDVSDLIVNGELQIKDNLEFWEYPVFYHVLANGKITFNSDATQKSLDYYKKEKHFLVHDELIKILKSPSQGDKVSEILLYHNKYNDKDHNNVKDIMYDPRVTMKTLRDKLGMDNKDQNVRRHSLPLQLEDVHAILTGSNNKTGYAKDDLEWLLKINVNRISLYMYAAKFGFDPYELYYRYTKLVPLFDNKAEYLTYRHFKEWNDFVKLLDEKYTDRSKGKTDKNYGFLKPDRDLNKCSKNFTLIKIYLMQLQKDKQAYDEFLAKGKDKYFTNPNDIPCKE